MLAQAFRTADQLNITENQRKALCKTLTLLETGRLKHYNITVDDNPKKVHRRLDFLFNMSYWSASYGCGTVACIGGTAELVGNLQSGELESSSWINYQLKLLFYPNTKDYSTITPEQAAGALRNYLTTGKPNWDEILGD